MARGKFRVEHRPAGYEGWKDQIPRRKPRWKAIIATIIVFLSFGACMGITGFRVYRSLTTDDPLPTLFPSATLQTLTLAPSAIHTATPTPTHTATATTSPTATITATMTATATVTFTATPTLTPSRTPVLAPLAVVSLCNAIVRTRPDLSSTAVASISCGARLPVLQQQPEWTQVLYSDGQVGWIASHLLTMSDDHAELPVPTELPSFIDFAIVIDCPATLRSEPLTSSPALSALGCNEVVPVIQEVDGWIETFVSNQTGWIESEKVAR